MTLMRAWRHWAVALLSIGLGACAGPGALMQATPPQEAPTAKADEAMVVFMRASYVGSAISASVFDVTGAGQPTFIGIVNNGTKIAYPVKPGEYTFMVVSEAADFLQAKVAAGKTYYAMVTPRMGMWKARFSFRPVRGSELGGSEFAGWSSGTQYVSNTPQSRNWAASNAADISQKRASYWADWSSKPADERASQTLTPEDGR
jgi:hypothetical protein